MTKINSKSEQFNKFVEDVDNILSKTQHLTADGKELDYSDSHFQDQLLRLSKVRIDFENGFSIYPINEHVARDLIYSELMAINEAEDAKAARAASEAHSRRRENV